MQEPRGKSGDLWSGLTLALLGGYIVEQARSWEYLTPDGPGPGFFPLWYGIAILVLSLVLVAGALRARQGRASGMDWSGLGRAMAVWAGLAVSVGAFAILGFAVGFALFTFFVVAVMYRRPLRVAAAVGVALAAGFYLVFAVALGVALPVGALGF